MSGFAPSLSPRFVAYVRDYLLDQGVEPQTVFDATALSAGDDSELGAPVPLDQICELFTTTSKLLDKPYYGLDLAANYHFESSSLLIVAFMAAPDVRHAGAGAESGARR